MPGELIGLVTGPLTNLALAVRDEPNLPSLLRRLVIMGGSFDYRGNTTPVAEWNISVDPEAAAEVFDAWGRAADAESDSVASASDRVRTEPDREHHADTDDPEPPGGARRSRPRWP